ncbi:MAG TPA: hypothetical protein VNT23_09600, partial [Gaiellaceae bacterium]|nr:hypothetical protein [Gaiellaceae bacterium]
APAEAGANGAAPTGEADPGEPAATNGDAPAPAKRRRRRRRPAAQRAEGGGGAAEAAPEPSD